jgi:Restriction Endonuclease associating with ARP
MLSATAMASKPAFHSRTCPGVEAPGEVAEMNAYAAQLRHELSVRNSAYATAQGLAHVSSFGVMPVVVYEPCADRHGNFLDASYRTILRNPEWKRRLDKIHTLAKQSLPRADRRLKELDSCTSSDALLMNVFCHPRTMGNEAVCSMLGVEVGTVPRFGFPARVPFASGNVDRTEVDMRIGGLLVEAKLTESDFQSVLVETMEKYRDFHDVFHCRELTRVRGRYASYQLIRNVLAAYARNLSFCVLLDARRPDLIEAWYAVMRCIRIADLRTRCKVLTWQELSETLPAKLQTFLLKKYRIGGKEHAMLDGASVTVHPTNLC